MSVRCVTPRLRPGRRPTQAAAGAAPGIRPPAVGPLALGRLSLGLVALGLGLSACGGGAPAEPPAVRDGWAAVVDDGSVAAYVTITAAERDELTGARVDRDVAARVEVVSPAPGEEGGPGHLGHLDPGGSIGPDHGHSVELPPDRPVTLEPGGAYLAVGPLTSPLAPDDTFPVTLQFADAPDATVDITVRIP